jgi:hypothetical protein
LHDLLSAARVDQLGEVTRLDARGLVFAVHKNGEWSKFVLLHSKHVTESGIS